MKRRYYNKLHINKVKIVFLFHNQGLLSLGQLDAALPNWSTRSLFSSKIRGKKRKTSRRASATVSVTCERRCREPLAAWALGDVTVIVTLPRLFCVFPQFSRKRGTAHNLLTTDPFSDPFYQWSGPFQGKSSRNWQMKLTEIKWENVQGSVYTWNRIFKLFIRLGQTPAFRWQTNRWYHDCHMISLFSRVTNPKLLKIFGCLNSSGVVWKENIWFVFSVTAPFLNPFGVVFHEN